MDAFMSERRCSLRCRNPPHSQRAAIDRLRVVMMMVSIVRAVAAVRRPSGGAPRMIRRRKRRSAAPVAHQPIIMGGVDGYAAMHHHRLQVSALRVLSLSLVGVLVAAESLGGGEVSAAVMALEFPAARVAAARLFASCLSFSAVVFIGMIDTAAAEFLAEKPNPTAPAAALLFGRKRRADEGQLRERLHAHEVVSLSLSPIHGSEVEFQLAR